MNWIIDSIIATFGGAIYTSFLKLSQSSYDATSVVSFVLFLSFIFYYITGGYYNLVKNFETWGFISGITFGLTTYFFNKALSLVNNPGIPSSIVRSQVVLTFFVSLFLFNEKFSWKKFAPILVIILGCLITVYPNLKSFDAKNMEWIYLTIIAGICTTGNDITSKLSLNKIANKQFLVLQMLGASLTNIILQFFTKKTVGLQKLSKDKKKKSSKIHLFNKYPQLLLAIILSSLIVFRTYLGSAMKSSKNPAYPRAIFNSQFLVSLLLSLVIQKDTAITKAQGIGSAVILLGVIFTTIFGG